MDSQTRLHLINSYGNNQEEGWREGQKGELGKEKEKKCGKKKCLVTTRVELATLALLAPRSNQLTG
jgi:hypothetical protein